jgi:adenosylhomocysteine nucleosidase
MTTAILSALAEEQHGLLELLETPQRIAHAGRDFWRGQWHDRDVVLALSKIGKVAAAITATALVEQFKVERILFTGVAGGLADGVNVGDMVVATEFMQHDMDASPIFPRYEVPLYGRARFACDPGLTALLEEAARRALAIAGAAREARVHRGLVVSGDRFVSTAAESLALRGALPDALAVEMEGAAVAQVCFDYGIAFAAVRTISDRADDEAHVDFSKFIEQVAGRYAATLLPQWLALL